MKMDFLKMDFLTDFLAEFTEKDIHIIIIFFIIGAIMLYTALISIIDKVENKNNHISAILSGIIELQNKDRDIIGKALQQIIETQTKIESKVDIGYHERETVGATSTVLDEDDEITVEELIDNIKIFIKEISKNQFEFGNRDIRTAYRNIRKNIINLASVHTEPTPIQ